VCLCVCLSAAACLHYCTDPDVTWGAVWDAPSCGLLSGFAISARVALLWQHNANPSYKLASITRYDNIVRTRNVSECSVLVVCLVCVCQQDDLKSYGWIFGRPLQVTVRPICYTGPLSCLTCLSATLVYCGQTVGWIKMPLDRPTEVGLDPGRPRPSTLC